jgi:tetratricopeptide (TPR) repeat protein
LVFPFIRLAALVNKLFSKKQVSPTSLQETKSGEKKSSYPPEKIQAHYKGIEFLDSVTIKCTRNPFDFYADCLFYLENDPDPLINDYLTNHTTELADILTEIHDNCFLKLNIIYLPAIIKQIIEQGDPKLLSYYFPFIVKDQMDGLKSDIVSFDTKTFSKMVLDAIGYSGDIFPGFLRRRKYEGQPDNEYEFSCVNITAKDQHELEKKLWFYFSHIGDRGEKVMYQLALGEAYITEGRPDKLTENNFDYGGRKLALEIQDKIDKLIQSGNQHLLLNILGHHYAMNQKPGTTGQNGLSRLVISDDFRLFLPDYNNLEIELTPLPKTVFLFFLRHPEGVLLKFLIDHHSELLGIYKLVSNRETWDEMVFSIDELTNPTKNSINEKCSRIKEAFVNHFEDRIARNYYISGDRGKEKGIILSRDMVTWHVDLSLLPSMAPAKTADDGKENENRVKELYTNAKATFDLKDYIKAIEQFTKVLEVNKFHFNAVAHRAIAYFELGDYTNAIIDNNRAIELHPEVNFAHHNRAEAKLMIKSYQGALEDINAYIRRVNYKCAPSYFMRGLIKMELYDIQGACQDWFNAKYLGHPQAQEYLKKYKQFKVDKPEFDKRGS